MGLNKQERKYKDVKTTEMLDFLGKGVDYKDSKASEKYSDYQEEIPHRAPFAHIKDKIEMMQKSINELQNAVDKLLVHKHDNEGNLTIPVSKAIEKRYF